MFDNKDDFLYVDASRTKLDRMLLVERAGDSTPEQNRKYALLRSVTGKDIAFLAEAVCERLNRAPWDGKRVMPATLAPPGNIVDSSWVSIADDTPPTYVRGRSTSFSAGNIEVEDRDYLFDFLNYCCSMVLKQNPQFIDHFLTTEEEADEFFGFSSVKSTIFDVNIHKILSMYWMIHGVNSAIDNVVDHAIRYESWEVRFKEIVEIKYYATEDGVDKHGNPYHKGDMIDTETSEREYTVYDVPQFISAESLEPHYIKDDEGDWALDRETHTKNTLLSVVKGTYEPIAMRECIEKRKPGGSYIYFYAYSTLSHAEVNDYTGSVTWVRDHIKEYAKPISVGLDVTFEEEYGSFSSYWKIPYSSVGSVGTSYSPSAKYFSVSLSFPDLLFKMINYGYRTDVSDLNFDYLFDKDILKMKPKLDKTRYLEG